MNFQEIIATYGSDILLALINAILYILVFVFTKSIKKVKDSCITSLTKKESTIKSDVDKVSKELEKTREENVMLKSRLEKIETALCRFSEADSDEVNKNE